MLAAHNAIALTMASTAVIVVILMFINGGNHRLVLYFFATIIGIFPDKFEPAAMEHNHGI
jgi:hypothetical protein